MPLTSCRSLKSYVRMLMMTVFCFVTAASFAETITITTGLSDYQVFQRNEADKADIPFSGSCDLNGSGKLQTRVLTTQTGVTMLDWREVGSYQKGKFQGSIKELPIGGPYDIEIAFGNPDKQSVDKTKVHCILVGDLWILAGQSNMQGVGDLSTAEEPSIQVNSFGYDEQWHIASEPLHWLLDSIDPVHHLGLEGKRLEEGRIAAKKGAVVGAGLGLPFAKEMARITGVPVGLVPCAHGGTSMEQWDPAKKEQGGNSLYGSMYRRFVATGSKVTGVLWYQGESDAGKQAAPLFHDKFAQFVASVRKDFHDSDLPFYFVQIGRFVVRDENPYWNVIREQQRLCSLEIPNCRMVAAIDLDLDDLIHVSTDGHKRLGKRLANIACKDLFDHADLQYGPQLDRVMPIPFRVPKYRIAFKGVNSALQASGRVSGFSIRDVNEKDLGIIYKAEVTEDGQAIDLYFRELPAPGAALWYGHGFNPYCNVVDSRDMALAAFGPVYLDDIGYETFVKLAEEDIQSPSLRTLLPQAFASAAKNSQRSAELLTLVQKVVEGARPPQRAELYPYLFALGDFSHWDKWMETARTASIAERKRLVTGFGHAAIFPSLSCKYVSEWQIVGPFDNADDQGFEKLFGPEKNFTSEQTFANGLGEQVAWQTAATDDKGYLDFTNCFQRTQDVVAYALAKIEAKEPAEVPILLGSDDAAAVWVNGKEVHREHLHRSPRPAQDLIIAKLQQGVNDILIKVDQTGGDWGLYLQLVDKDRILIYK